MLSKNPNETDFDYHRRLIYGKLIDKTFPDTDYAEIAECVYGTPCSSDHARKMLYGSCRTLQMIDRQREQGHMTENALSDFDSQMFELRKERQRFFDQRTALNKVIRGRARQEELNDIIRSAICESKLPAFEYEQEDIQHGDNDLMVMLSDIHYGITVDNAWAHYNPDVCTDMMRRYLDRILEIAQTHHSENCYVLGLGDFISGSIHATIALANSENVVEQIMGISELIASFVAELSKHFVSVRFISVAGNHSRIAKKDEAPMNERLDDLIPFYLKARLANLQNVFIEEEAGEKIDCSMFAVSIRGLSYLGIHGDYDTTPAGIQTLQTMAERPLYAVVCGHKHHSYSESVQGVRIVMSGSFVAMDEYAVSKRLFSKPEQTVCVCDKDGIRCTYNVSLCP